MTVLQTFTKARRIRIKTQKLSQGDHEFLPAALEILDTPLSPIRTVLSATTTCTPVAEATLKPALVT